MKSILSVLVLFAFLSVPVQAQETTSATSAPLWKVDAAHSSVGFKVRHLGIATVSGHFSAYDAGFRYDPSDLSTLEVDATIQVASINTDNERRDNHLRSDDFFDAENHPELRFRSTSVRALDGGRFEITGDLTMRGTTKEVVLTGTVSEAIESRGSQRVFIEAEGVVNRFDYGLRWDSLTEAGGLVVGEDVRLVLEVSAARQ